MALTISGVVLLAVIVFFLLRFGYLRPLPMIAAALLGFLLASTGVGPSIQSGLNGAAQLISHIHV